MTSVLTQMLVKVVGITLISVLVTKSVRTSLIVSVAVKVVDSTMVEVMVMGKVSVLVT